MKSSKFSLCGILSCVFGSNSFCRQRKEERIIICCFHCRCTLYIDDSREDRVAPIG